VLVLVSATVDRLGEGCSDFAKTLERIILDEGTDHEHRRTPPADESRAAFSRTL
jgi:hypothetical protein